jgi:hypothetical protein
MTASPAPLRGNLPFLPVSNSFITARHITLGTTRNQQQRDSGEPSEERQQPFHGHNSQEQAIESFSDVTEVAARDRPTSVGDKRTKDDVP